MPHTIMIVDDDPDDIALTRRILKKTGRELVLTTASCGVTALALLENCGEPPSLMLLDMKMPGMTGIDVLLRLRADHRFRNLPVIVVTSSTLDSDRTAAVAAGANAFLHKALDLDGFGREIELHLQRWLDR